MKLYKLSLAVTQLSQALAKRTDAKSMLEIIKSRMVPANYSYVGVSL